MATKPSTRSIVLFEDHDSRIKELQAAIDPMLSGKYELKVFPLHKEPETKEGPYEDRLVKALGDPDFGDIVLLVTDRDLSTTKWGGLSEAAVTLAAAELGLPVACYRQAKTYPEDKFRRKPGNGKLELVDEPKARAKQIITLCDGFAAMERLMPLPAKKSKSPAKAAGKIKNRKAVPAPSPAVVHVSSGELLAKILGEPDISMQLDLFACGDQRTILELLKTNSAGLEDLSDADAKKLVVSLGVWLADLVMAYPGVLLNEIAAASYLDIYKPHFKKAEVRKLFAEAEYAAELPFASADAPMWWRHKLDELINQAGAISGLDLCRSKGLRGIRFCPCSVNPSLHAGYYCMATMEPLSDEESSGKLSWFPIGADLARLTKKTQRAIEPWIGA